MKVCKVYRLSPSDIIDIVLCYKGIVGDVEKTVWQITEEYGKSDSMRAGPRIPEFRGIEITTVVEEEI